jgi:hypothetical protein
MILLQCLQGLSTGLVGVGCALCAHAWHAVAMSGDTCSVKWQQPAAVSLPESADACMAWHFVGQLLPYGRC